MKYNLSEVNEVIRNRRTIYPEQFSERKVHREQIELLLENARWAPTHKMTQPWFFHVFMEDGLQRLADWQSNAYLARTPEEEVKQRKLEKLQNRPLKSSAVIMACMKRHLDSKLPEVEEIAAVSCAIQNMFLTATAYGLAFYWGSGGMTYTQEMKDFLGLEEDDICLGQLYIGYPTGDWPKGQRRPTEYFTKWHDQ